MGERTLRLHLSDGVVVELPGGRLTERDLPGRQGRLVLAALALARGRPVTRDELAEILWPDGPPATWDRTLAAVVSKLRTTLIGAGLPEDALGGAFGCYQLRAEDVWVDVLAARDEVRAAEERLRGGDTRAALASASVAAGLARRTFLTGETGDWVERQRAAQRASLVEALEHLAAAQLGRGACSEALAAASEAVELEPFRESAHALVMRAHELAGNRAEALRAYERCRTTLASELGVDPSPETRALHVRLLGGDDRLDESKPAAGNLPAAITSFVGRARELRSLVEQLSRDRLVTVTGPPGCGKTRLALEAARTPPDDVGSAWLVELASVRDGWLVPSAVASALGVAEDRLDRHLASVAPLVVLDNVEHVAEEAARIAARILSVAPRARVLATGRRSLGVTGEAVVRLEPFAIPAPDDPGAHACDAVRLFLERARVDAHVDDVVRICRSAGGLPLAIELAAARAAVLSPPELAVRLEAGTSILRSSDPTADPRHRTLDDLVDWSFRLLSEEQRTLLVRLSVFAAPFGIDAAERVGACDTIGPSEVLDVLTALVDRSLVTVDRRGARSRFGLLESVRDHAAARTGPDDDLRHAHLAYVRSLAEAAPHGGRDWLDRIEAVHDDVRSALRWAIERPLPAEAAALGAALGRFWHTRGHLSESVRWLDAIAGLFAVPCAERVEVTSSAGFSLQTMGRLDEAEERYLRAERDARTAADERGLARALALRGSLARRRGRFDEARVLLTESIDRCRRLGDRGRLAGSLEWLGIVEHLTGDLDAASALYEESLGLSREAGDRRAVAATLDKLGSLEAWRGNPSRSAGLYEESLGLSRELGDRVMTMTTAINLAIVPSLEASRRERLLAEAASIAAELGADQALCASKRNLAAIAQSRGETEAAGRLYVEAIDAGRRSSSAEHTADALGALAKLELERGDVGAARRYSLEAVETSRERCAPGRRAASLVIAAEVALGAGEIDEASAALDEAAEMDDAMAASVRADYLSARGMLALRAGAPDAADALEVAREAWRSLGAQAHEADVVDALAELALANGDRVTAASRTAEAERLRAELTGT